MKHSVTLWILVLAMSASGQSLLDAPWRAYDVADFPDFAPLAAAYGDVDGDSDLDAVVAREFWFSPGIAVLLNRGDGSFDAERLFNLSTSMSVGDIALADFDRDGDLDAVTSIAGNAGTDSRIALWRNNGDGTFAPAQLFAAGPGPTGLVVADFNGDGFPDVVTADNGYVAGSNATISLMRHNGMTGAQAGFLAPGATTVGDNSMRVDAADIDGDGDQDLVVGHASPAGGPDGINVLANDGTGRFSIVQSFTSVPGADRSSYAVDFADINADGRPGGERTSGGLTDLFFSDDSYLNIEARRSTEIAAASVEIVVEGTAPTDSPSTIAFVLEAGQTGEPTRQRIELFNFQSNQWEMIDERPSPFADTTVRVTVSTNAARFVQPGTRLLRARIGYHDRGVTFISWGGRLDVTAWEVGG